MPGAFLQQQRQKLEEEENHHMKTFMGNSYPCSFVHSASAAKPPRDHKREREERVPIVHLPYVAGISEWTRRVCKEFNIRVVFKLGPTLHSLLTKLKDPLPIQKQANVIQSAMHLRKRVYW